MRVEGGSEEHRMQTEIREHEHEWRVKSAREGCKWRSGV